MSVKSLLLSLTLVFWVSAGSAQGLLISRMQCQTTYQGIPFIGVFEVQLFQYASAVPQGAAGLRQQLNLMIRRGQAAQIPGTLVLMGEFQGGGAIVHIEAPNMVGGQGTGGIVVNGQAHRATHATFYLVQGGVLARTEDGVQIQYVCQ
jgi:hypothetical protein